MSHRRSPSPRLGPVLAGSDLAGSDLAGSDLAGSDPAPAVCAGDVCITCSDEAVQARVVELLPGGLARVDTGFATEEVSVALVDAAVGDVILVHAREAIALVPGCVHEDI
jgi:hydrogenase expression/formation protein HypC